MFGTLMQDEKIGPHGGGRFCAFSVQQFVGWPNKLSLHHYTALHYTTLHYTAAYIYMSTWYCIVVATGRPGVWLPSNAAISSINSNTY